jgi:hypothetical protein
MARDKITQYSATASENTVCGDVNIAENSALPSDMNNYAREIMTHLKNFSDGTDAIDALTVTGDLTVDTNTLHVDATNNRVGVGTASPANSVEISAANPTIRLTDTNASNQYSTISGNAGNVVIKADQEDSATGSIRFFVGGSEKGRFLEGGGLTFNGDTAAANALDDYEETSFSPTLEGQTTAGSSPTGTGRATKIGRAVIFNILFANVTVSGAAGLLVVRGMPFVPDSNVNNVFPVASYKLEAEASFSVATLSGGSTNVEILHIADEGIWDNANIINTSNIFLYISGVYTT